LKLLNVANKKCAINVKNTDGRCLEYCILASMFETVVSKVTDTALSKLRHHIKIPENQTYPIDIIRDVPKYEKLNNLHKYCDLQRRKWESSSILQ
jgi:hypothetical protein